MTEEDKFITVVYSSNFNGKKVFKKDGIIKLVKEPDNDYDDEAIGVEVRFAGKVGYVANSVNTVVRGTMSSGRLYDKINENAYGMVKFISKSNVIAKVLSEDEVEELKEDPQSDVNYI